MKTSRYTDSQIMAILKQVEAGTPVSPLCREHGMSSVSVRRTHLGECGQAASDFIAGDGRHGQTSSHDEVIMPHGARKCHISLVLGRADWQLL